MAQIDGTADMSMIVVRLYASPRYWLAGFLLPPAMSLLLDLVLETFQRTFKPKPYQILQVGYVGSVALWVGPVALGLRKMLGSRRWGP